MTHDTDPARRTGLDVLVLGATGVAGRSTLRALAAAGHRPWAHARTDAKADLVRSLGATPVRGNAEDDRTLRKWAEGKDAVVDLRVRIPGGARAALPWAWREYRRLRGPETARVASAARDAGVGVFLRDTVTMAYADGGESLLTEAAPVDAPGTLAANLAAERHVAEFTAAGGTGVVLRFGQFYGPDDDLSLDLLRRARRGQALVLGARSAWSSALHTDDVGPAVVAALGAPAGVYNVVDDEPMRRGEWIGLLAESVGRTGLRQPPRLVTTLGGPPLRSLARSQRVSAARFTEVTGWRPGVPSRRVGWPQVVSAHAGSAGG